MENETTQATQTIAQPAASAAAPMAKPAFKSTTFGGFDKQSVLAYIYELNNNAKQAQERLSAQMDELTTAREQLGKAVKDLEQRLNQSEEEREALRAELGQEKARTGELSDMLERLSSELERQREIAEHKDVEAQEYALAAQKLEASNRELNERRSEYEKSSIVVSELIVRARAEAEEILEEANKQAQDLVADAGRSLLDVNNQFGIFKTEMERIEQKIESAVISMQRKFADIGEAIDSAERNVQQSCHFHRNELKLVTDDPEDLPAFRDTKRVEPRGFFRSTAHNG